MDAGIYEFAHFTHVEPLAGFGPGAAGPRRPGNAAESFLASSPDGNAHDDEASCLAVAGRCRIRRGAGKPYLQCELSFPASEGWLEVHEGERLIDRAELILGWQHSAVSLEEASPQAELDLVFRGADGETVEGALVRALFLSDEWGRGRRRRLKCDMPFRMLAIYSDSSVFPCCARQWLNGDQMAGSTRTDTLSDIWNGPQYQRMRGEFLAGDYHKPCRADICPVLLSKMPQPEPSLPIIRAINEGHTAVEYGPVSLLHDIDRGCNLECVMCRDEKILPDRGKVDKAILDIGEAIDLGSIEDVAFSGAGEIFVMAKVIKMLESDKFSSRGIALLITTNLTHFNQQLWDRIGHNQFSHVVVSADGCSSEIYDSIRIGAKWPTVEKNMQFLAELRQQGKVGHLTWNYTVQRANLADVGPAIRRARELGFDRIRLIAQLGALSRTNGNMFEDHDLEALDRLYDTLEAEGAFDDPMVITSELGIGDRCYRRFEHRLSQVRHIFERHGYSRGNAGVADRPEWDKCVRLIEELIADIESGAAERPRGLPSWAADFLAEIAAHAGRPVGPLRRLRRAIAPRPFQVSERRVGRWSRDLLRTAQLAPERSEAA